MKNLTNILWIVLGIFIIASCDVRDTSPVANSEPGTPSITSPDSNQTYSLQEDQADDTLITIEWTSPDYGFPSAISYSIQMDEADSNFGNPSILGTTQSKTSFSITTGTINTLLLGAGYTADQEVGEKIRVVASLSDSLSGQISDPISMSFTPYSVCRYCPEIYVPGNYIVKSGYYSANWDPAHAPSLHTVEGKDVYQGYVYMGGHADNAGSIQFKFTGGKSFDTNWGTGGSVGTLVQGAGNLSVSETGYYQMHVDLNALTYSASKTTWSVIGAGANGWNSGDDVAMTYQRDEKVWTKTLDLTQGPIKFRANDAWDINFGDDGGDGTLEAGGANISVPSAGNYTVTLNLNDYPHTYSLTKN